MKRIEMIKDKKLFNTIIKTAKYKKNDYFVIYYINNETNNTKYGISVSSKYGSAVERNRIKRQVRTIIDNNRNLFKKENNYIIMIRKSCKNQKYNVLNEALCELL